MMFRVVQVDAGQRNSSGTGEVFDMSVQLGLPTTFDELLLIKLDSIDWQNLKDKIGNSKKSGKRANNWSKIFLNKRDYTHCLTVNPLSFYFTATHPIQ